MDGDGRGGGLETDQQVGGSHGGLKKEGSMCNESLAWAQRKENKLHTPLSYEGHPLPTHFLSRYLDHLFCTNQAVSLDNSTPRVCNANIEHLDDKA